MEKRLLDGESFVREKRGYSLLSKNVIQRKKNKNMEGRGENVRNRAGLNGRWYRAHTIYYEKSTVYGKKYAILTKKHHNFKTIFHSLNRRRKYIISIKRIFDKNYLKSLLQDTFVEIKITLVF